MGSKRKIRISVIIILIITSLMLTVFGRYIYNNIKEAYVASKQFYFTSNILAEEGSNYIYDNWGGKNVYPIQVELYSYENSISKLSYDLEYEVTCSTPDTDKVKCTVNSYGEEAKNTETGKILVTENNTSSVIVYVEPIGGSIAQGDSVTIEITASTTKPYKKTISTEITLIAAMEGNNTYSIEDITNRDYALLKLTCPSDGTTVTLEFDPTKLRIDSNDEVYINRDKSEGSTGTTTIEESVEIEDENGNITTETQTSTYVNKITYEMPAETTKYIKFYKVDKSQNYTYPGGSQAISPIKVTMGGHEIIYPGILLDKTTAEIKNGEEIQILATLIKLEEENLIWESSDDSIATVIGSGENNAIATVTGVKGGNAIITARNEDETVKATCEVTVIQKLTSSGTYLPTGFSEVSAATATEGLTIADELGNQYVWVEVPRNATVYNDMADDSEDDLNDDGTEDDIDDEDILNYDLTSDLTSEQLAAIETELKEYTKTYRKGTSYTDTWYSEAQHGFEKTEDYNAHKEKMLASVFRNEGFYVGKYETGIADTEPEVIDDENLEARTAEGDATQTPVIQANAYPYNYVTNKQAQELASTKFNGGGYTTSLMFGVQWDLVLKYMETKATNQDTIVSELNSDSTEWGNYYNNKTTNVTNSSAKYAIESDWSWKDGAYGKKTLQTTVVLSTGASSDFSKMGIYDFAGNMFEWTLEYSSDYSSPNAFRGGVCSFFGSDYPASTRLSNNTNYASRNYGFRLSIF